MPAAVMDKVAKIASFSNALDSYHTIAIILGDSLLSFYIRKSLSLGPLSNVQKCQDCTSPTKKESIMSAEKLCLEIEEDMEVTLTQSTLGFDKVLVTHADFSLVIEVTDKQVLLHNIKLLHNSDEIGNALATIIRNWATVEEFDVIALDVSPDAENIWIYQGFFRDQDNELCFLTTEVEDSDGDDY